VRRGKKRRIEEGGEKERLRDHEIEIKAKKITPASSVQTTLGKTKRKERAYVPIR
jgi:hypothetical protein